MRLPGFRKQKPRSENRFREREIARVLRAARSAGGVERIEVDPAAGTIRIFPAKPGDAEMPTMKNPWDEVP
jgi:hypothetical protein